MKEILFKGAGVNLFEASVRKRFRFLYRYRYIKFAQDGCGQMLVHGVVFRNEDVITLLRKH